MSEADEIDAWLVKRLAALREPLLDRVSKRDTKSREYLIMLGQHQAFMTARSFISAGRKQAKQ
ncbi:hypothetical protein [Novosphingobium sp. JCM 18896]|uniref:hypothetical protein n=1 Tax=Novosphingobium sp. JCM 18896 TaxID=2989731 RepID=UPI00222285D7|nr:hypothetical protein [Novosphingobium sp. JCM 18896]MCW1431416.1 hypothetical protein [Novosphingobium sp. JCM 18896]